MGDYFHEFRDLCTLLHQWERNAYAAIGKEDAAAQKFAHATSDSNLAKRLQPYAQAHQACAQAMARYDPLAMLRQWLRETWQWCSPEGRLRTAEGVRSALTLLLPMMAELDCAAMIHTRKPMQKPLDAMLVPCAQAEAIAAELRAVVPHHAWDCLGLAWHHDHFVSHSQSKPKRSHQRARQEWLACAEGLLGDACDTRQALVFDPLDSSVRASSLVEMVHALMRPYLKSCQGHITQEACNLSMFSQNHRRYQSGTREGKAPLELLAGASFEAEWWERFLQQGKREEDATDNGALPSRPPLQLMVNSGGRPDRQAIAPGQALVEQTGAPENDRRHTVPQAASSFSLG